MPVKINVCLNRGWKAVSNERLGDVLEVQFIDMKTNKVLFAYAPKCEDATIWEKIFETLREYDSKLISLRSTINKIENADTFVSLGKPYPKEEKK